MSYAPVFLLWLLPAHVPAAEPIASAARACLPATVRCEALVPAGRQVQDRWFAEDKMRHLSMAFATTTFGHAAARMAGVDARPATALGAAATIVASIGKEVFDRRAGGIFSYRDLVWDAAGILLGIAIVGNAR